MKITKFKNGNFSVKFEKEYCKSFEGKYQMIADLCNSIELDFEVVGNWYCIGNDCMALDLVNYNTNKKYTITAKDCEKYINNKTVRLYGYKDNSIC